MFSHLEQRGYRETAAVGGQNGDWPLSLIGEDSAVWQNIWAIRARMRDLFDTNPYYIKYRETLWANIFGDTGIMLRMKVKETEDRVVHSPDEKWALVAHERRINRLREWAEQKTGTKTQQYRAFHLADNLDRTKRDELLRGKATILVGDPDVYANQLIERKFKEWQLAKFCDARGNRTYNQIRQLRLLSAARDGDFFIRMVRDPRANKFGFTLQLINAEWCDQFFNTILPNGNVVRMGIEYPQFPWGLGKAVAFYFIKRQPMDWQFSIPGSFNFSSGNLHDRIPAEQIIHYARWTDGDSTRPAPWGANTIPKARQLDQYELAEVVAAREQACKVGWLYSDVLPEGGYSGTPVDPRNGLPTQPVGPGETHALPYGVKYQQSDPKHPNGNFENFRKGQLRSWAAGMPGADYNVIANDLEGINFSAGRLGRLDTNEISKVIQRFDIDTAEIPVFEGFLDMSLITGAVPLPLSKFEKFNKPLFQGRRWRQVDEVKEVTAAALRVANHFSSDQRECDEIGVDFEEILFEQAEANMLKEQLGIPTAKTVETPQQFSEGAEDVEETEENEDEEGKKPKANSKKHALAGRS
jgi:lambda family phage portal protein